MTTLEPILTEQPFFRGMSAPHLHLLTGCTANVRFETGQLIFRQGDAADHFYVIREGKIAVEIHSPQRGAIIVQTLGADEVLGWSWLTPPYRWRFDARAVEPTRALSLDGKCLRTKCEQDHDLGYELLKRFCPIIAQRLDATRLQLLDVYGIHA